MNGSKEAKYIIRTTAEGKELRIPTGTIRGACAGEQISIYGGQHGTEYAGIEAVQRLYRELDPAAVRGTIVISLATNEESLLNRTQFAPTLPEVKDMMIELGRGSQYIINCHGGEYSEAMCPYVICRLIGDEKAEATVMQMAKAFGVGYVSLSRYRGVPPPDKAHEAASWWLWPKKNLCDELRIPEITPEVGEKGSRDDSLMYTGIVNVLRELDFLEGEVTDVPELKVIGDRYWLTADEQGMFFPEVEVCQYVTAGQRIGVVRDYFGSVLQVVEAPADMKVMSINVSMPVKKDGYLLWLGEVE